jgi:hypothetical protein
MLESACLLKLSMLLFKKQAKQPSLNQMTRSFQVKTLPRWVQKLKRRLKSTGSRMGTLNVG